MKIVATLALLCAVSVVASPSSGSFVGRAAATFDSVVMRKVAATPELPPSFDMTKLVDATNEPLPTITIQWNKNAETNVIGYWVFTNMTRRTFTSSTNLLMDLPDGTNSYSVTATNSAGLESQLSALVWWPVAETNIYTLSASVTNWPSISWTNPPTIPQGSQRFYRVLYGTNSATPITSNNLLGPWVQFASWPKLTTTNKNIILKFESKRF